MEGIPRNPQLGVRTETEKTGFLTKEKTHAVGRAHAVRLANAVAGTTDKLFRDGKGPDFSSNPAIQLGILG
jgi:hypothetical protein